MSRRSARNDIRSLHNVCSEGVSKHYRFNVVLCKKPRLNRSQSIPAESRGGQAPFRVFRAELSARILLDGENINGAPQQTTAAPKPRKTARWWYSDTSSKLKYIDGVNLLIREPRIQSGKLCGGRIRTPPANQRRGDSLHIAYGHTQATSTSTIDIRPLPRRDLAPRAPGPLSNSELPHTHT